MNFEEWEPYYNEILREFGFSKEDDENSAKALWKILRIKRLVSLREIEDTIHNKVVNVFGSGDSLPEAIKRDEFDGVIIASDGTTTQLLDNSILPDIIVTDLDGVVEDQIDANGNGAIVVVHAHGDNMNAINRYAPRFEGRVIGTTQAEPFDCIYNFGGFTDGDRAVLLAGHFNAKLIRLIGFDFDRVGRRSICRDKEMKLKKLKWAERLIGTVANVEFWGR